MQKDQTKRHQCVGQTFLTTIVSYRDETMGTFRTTTYLGKKIIDITFGQKCKICGSDGRDKRKGRYEEGYI